MSTKRLAASRTISGRRIEVSWLLRPRVLLVCAGAAVLVLLLFLISIGTSDYPLTPIDVIRILLGGGRRVENVVVFDVALPRALVALLVGFGLGLCGALTQLIAQNPLATPDILGITAGASAAAVAALAFATSWGAVFADIGVPTSALIGALATALVMYLLAWPGRKGGAGGLSTRGVNPFRLVLIGVGMTWMLQAATSFLLTRAEINDVARAQVWLVGSVSNATWSKAWPVAGGVAVAIVVVIALSRQIDALSLGPDLARGLGIRTGAVSTVVLLLAVVVSALSVSAAGPIAFVALLAPQIAMRVTGSAIPTPLASGLLGSMLVVGGDLLCRSGLPDVIPWFGDIGSAGVAVLSLLAVVGGPVMMVAVLVAPLLAGAADMLNGLPVGIVTAALGGPFLIYLMVTMSRKATA